MKRSRKHNLYYTGDSLNGVYAPGVGGFTSPFYLDYHAPDIARECGLTMKELQQLNEAYKIAEYEGE